MLKQNRVAPCTKWMMDCGWRCRNGRDSWCPASFTHRRPVPSSCSCGVQNVWTRVPAPHTHPLPNRFGRPTGNTWAVVISLLSPLSSLPISVRCGSSDPHEKPAGVRRGAGRRHPHGLQRFQLPALRPLLVRDQRRERACYRTCWLPARRFNTNLFFFFPPVWLERTEAASRLPVGVNVGYVKQPRSLLSMQAPYIAVPVSRARPVCRCLLFFFFFYLIEAACTSQRWIRLLVLRCCRYLTETQCQSDEIILLPFLWNLSR